MAWNPPSQIPFIPPFSKGGKRGIIWLTFLKKMLFCAKKLIQLSLGSKMIGNKIGHRLDPFLYKALNKVFGKQGNPNSFTLLGFFATLIASLFILKEFWVAAGLMIILSGVFDLFDGVIARRLGKVTDLGGFLDSVLDRYSDLLLLLALLIHYLRKEAPSLVILTAIVSIGTVLIPYIRAKAEAIQIPCNIGLMERAERLILLSAGVLFHWMEPILWALAILTHFTVFQRIFYVWKKLRSPLESENSKSQIPNPK
jgi:CDP-diacylglycerol--glycerol-3-phosphate 3-phosphatidyltransferase